MRRFLLIFNVLPFIFFSALAQTKDAEKKYPSLFWEITGNGLKKPSYLFGTMHVSSKMVFHLSDSFYYALRNADAVALELNPESWQDEMFQMQKAQINLANFSQGKMNDYLQQSSFRLNRYEEDIKRALTEEPTVVNNLLYRSFQPSADFEENTYLDLYIYQTGRKLGKQAAGVENYLESEKLMAEAYAEMAKDKNKKRSIGDGEFYYEIQKKIQQAYRNGDLDLMDSLQSITSVSDAFYEKFLYLRNEIQANSIDTILKRQSLFAGVGAAHLPGRRGVIELLRKKGFHLRPIFMQDRDAQQKDEIDKLRVPVIFRAENTQDGLIQMQLPGKFYKREEARGNESWQYSDMNNGSYYMLTRVRTHAEMMGQTDKTVLHKVDSMLYENIPGKILKKTLIVKNGFAGFDITNKTRRGDLQRYEIIVTPFEVLVFKMSGSEGYVDGKEAEQFFNSIKVKSQATNTWHEFEPLQGGFKVRLPNTVDAAYDKEQTYASGRWEYESVESGTGNGYMIWKKSLYNFDFLEEDTFDLALMEESFKSSEIINRQLSRSMGINNHIPFLKSRFSLKDGGFITMKAFINGPHYYLLAEMSKDKKAKSSAFFNSFRITPFRYNKPQYYPDSTLQMEVFTSVRPEVDTVVKSWMDKAGNEAESVYENLHPNRAKIKTGIFKDDSTGESILVTLQTFPKYFYSSDPDVFWNEQIDGDNDEEDMVVTKKIFFKQDDSVSGYNVVLTDTNSSRSIKTTYFLYGQNLLKCSTITDTSVRESSFVKSFFSTAKPLAFGGHPSVFSNKTDTFLKDLTGKDSTAAKLALQSFSYIPCHREDVEKFTSLINSLRFGDNNYFDLKSKLIMKFGSADDVSSKEGVVIILKNLFEKSTDTSYFQNAVLSALANLKTKSSYKLLKELLVQDPPVFENFSEYGRIIGPWFDSLQLAKTLLPEVIQLASLEDYKPYINSLLQSLVDSGYIKAADYSSYFGKLYFDAKIELKKQQNKQEKEIEQDDNIYDYSGESYSPYKLTFNRHSGFFGNSTMNDYASLLMPFYEDYSSVPKYFEKLLASKDIDVKLNAARLLLANNKKIPDSLFASVASQDKYRAKLLEMLNKVNKSKLFPSAFKKQESVAKALLLNNGDLDEFAEVELVSKQLVQAGDKKGRIYFFRYKINSEDEWKIGISGMQPENEREVNTNVYLTKLTDKKINPNEPVESQFEDQLKQMLFAKHKSFFKFYDKSDSYFFRNEFDN